jgi:hypothetical protein
MTAKSEQKYGSEKHCLPKYKMLESLNYLVSEPAEGAEPASVLEPEDLQGGGDDHLLLLVVGRGDTLECLQPLQGQLPALSLVGRHPADSPGKRKYQCPGGLHRNLDKVKRSIKNLN